MAKVDPLAACAGKYALLVVVSTWHTPTATLVLSFVIVATPPSPNAVEGSAIYDVPATLAIVVPGTICT